MQDQIQQEWEQPQKENDNYIINGHKWFTSSFDGASHFAIVMVVTDPDGRFTQKASQ